MPRWKRNLVVLSIAQFLTMTAFQSYMPFIAYYVQELGATSYEAALNWVAVFQSGSAFAMMVTAPIWGSLADRYGRRMMLIRATMAGSVIAFLMGLVAAPEQLVVLRIVQGGLCGTVAAAVTLVSTNTPEEHMGTALGVIQTAQFAGQAMGPVVGGLLADALGYRAVFPIAGVLISISLILIVTLVREQFHAPEKRPKRQRVSLRAGMNGVLDRGTLVLLISLGSISFALMVLSPILSLYIKSLTLDEARLATLAGAVISVSALTSSAAAPLIGRLGDKIGQKAVLLGCTVGMAVIHIPQAFVTSPMQLLVLRAIQGIFMGGTMPTANALLARNTAPDRRGTVFGLSTSIQAGGRAVAPMVGAGVANLWGMSPVFLVTSGIFALVATLVATMVHVDRPRSAIPAAADHAPAES